MIYGIDADANEGYDCCTKGELLLYDFVKVSHELNKFR